MKAILGYCLFLIYSVLLVAQPKQALYEHFYNQSKDFGSVDLELSLAYADSALMVSSALNDSLKVEAYLLKADAINKMGNASAAMILLQEVDTLVLGDVLKSDLFHLQGVISEHDSRYLEALDYHLRSLRLRQANKLVEKIAGSYNELAFVYRAMGQQEKAIVMLKEMQEACPEDDHLCTSRATFNIGLMVLELDRHAEAIPIFKEAVSTLEEDEHPQLFSRYYNNLSNCYERLLHVNAYYYDSALYYGYKSLEIKKRLKNYRGIANTHNTLAATYERASDYINSGMHSREALRLADSLNLLPIKRNALLYLITSEIKLGTVEHTNDHFEELLDVMDVLNKESSSEVINEMAAKYEAAKKDAENELLRTESTQQRRINYLLIGLAIVMLLILVLLIYLYRLKQRTNDQLRADKLVIQEQSEKLQQLNELKSNFFANISHELRTPLTLIQGNAEAVLRSDKIPVQAVEPARKIKRNVKQMTLLVDDLLDLSKLELKKDMVNLRPIYLNNLIARVVAAFSSLAESNQIALSYESDISDQLVVDVDEAQLEKVLNNLLYNSFKFVSIGGKVQVTTLAQSDTVSIRVIDNGSGIPESDIPFIFDRFYQAGANESRKGSGLGLAISKELVELMNGKVEAKNHVQGGAQLEVTFPISNLEPSIEDELVYKKEVQSVDESEVLMDLLKIPSDTSVLIVEDNKLLQQYLQDVLKDHFELFMAENGQDALDQLKKVKPNLILTDVMMPVMDGWEFIEHLREDMALSKIPVIVLTAVAENTDRIKGLRLGVDDYIIKPFEVDELLVRITNVINNLRERIKWAKEFDEEEEPDLTEEHDMVLQIRDFVKEHIADKKLNVLQLAHHLGLSERQLYRKTAETVGMSPSKLITELRLQYARELLVSKRFEKLAQISSEIGFESTSYFSKLYQERFGKKPTDYFS
ncbi:ATP-binding protein [Marinoscillum sp.]|uniref:ATP-binding protein n=1 Tax=Marinoscillum sp. TaxID=2024838 RepID=UPI003BAC544F